MQPITTYNPLIPAPIIIHDKLVNEYFALLDHLIFIASQKPIGAPPCPNAIKYGTSIICLQHITRSKRKEKMVINLIESLVDRERDLLISEAERQVKRWLDELKRQLEFVLPPVRAPLKLFKEQLIERAEDEANRILDEYKRRIKSYLEAYRAYIHRRLYASQHAALVGALLPKRENQNRRKEQGEDEITTNILYYSNIAATTAVVEGLNRVLRGRIRKSLNYRNLQLVESVAKLIVLNHNTRVLCDGKTPYEHVGIDVSDMEYNPFKSLGRVYDRIGYYDLPEDTGRVTIRREVYRRYRKKTAKLLRPTFELPSTDDEVNWATVM